VIGAVQLVGSKVVAHFFFEWLVERPITQQLFEEWIVLLGKSEMEMHDMLDGLVGERGVPQSHVAHLPAEIEIDLILSKVQRGVFEGLQEPLAPLVLVLSHGIQFAIHIHRQLAAGVVGHHSHEIPGLGFKIVSKFVADRPTKSQLHPYYLSYQLHLKPRFVQ